MVPGAGLEPAQRERRGILNWSLCAINSNNYGKLSGHNGVYEYQIII
ncbi:hypothetical protein [Escherichia phage vB_EcoM-720R5]|nr:hypothetical protein [Escherichia phage vB_EcoM-720R5]URC10600.1 hypothetical protein [Escherichia phage vB_EcoM-705R4]